MIIPRFSIKRLTVLALTLIAAAGIFSGCSRVKTKDDYLAAGIGTWNERIVPPGDSPDLLKAGTPHGWQFQLHIATGDIADFDELTKLAMAIRSPKNNEDLRMKIEGIASTSDALRAIALKLKQTGPLDDWVVRVFSDHNDGGAHYYLELTNTIPLTITSDQDVKDLVEFIHSPGKGGDKTKGRKFIDDGFGQGSLGAEVIKEIHK